VFQATKKDPKLVSTLLSRMNYGGLVTAPAVQASNAEYDRHILARMIDFFNVDRMPWPRRLWDIGSLLALEELWEAGAWAAEKVLSSSACDWQRAELRTIVGPDLGLGQRELRQELTKLLSDPLPAPSPARRRLRELILHATSGYVEPLGYHGRRFNDRGARPRATFSQCRRASVGCLLQFYAPHDMGRRSRSSRGNDRRHGPGGSASVSGESAGLRRPGGAPHRRGKQAGRDSAELARQECDNQMAPRERVRHQGTPTWRRIPIQVDRHGRIRRGRPRATDGGANACPVLLSLGAERRNETRSLHLGQRPSETDPACRAPRGASVLALTHEGHFYRVDRPRSAVDDALSWPRPSTRVLSVLPSPAHGRPWNRSCQIPTTRRTRNDPERPPQRTGSRPSSRARGHVPN